MSFARVDTPESIEAIIPEVSRMADTVARYFQGLINEYQHPGASFAGLRSYATSCYDRTHSELIKNVLSSQVNILNEKLGFTGVSMAYVPDLTSVRGATGRDGAKNSRQKLKRAMTQVIAIIAFAVDVAGVHAMSLDLPGGAIVGGEGDRGLFASAFGNFRKCFEAPELAAFRAQLSTQFDAWIATKAHSISKVDSSKEYSATAYKIGRMSLSIQPTLFGKGVDLVVGVCRVLGKGSTTTFAAMAAKNHEPELGASPHK